MRCGRPPRASPGHTVPDPAAATAEAQLARILYILAAARGEDGVSVRELATRLGVEPATIRDDVAEVTGREFYHPAASVPEMTILLERGRISVPVAGEFRRPMRLTPREAGALGLALRARAAEATSPLEEELLELATSLERALTAPSPRTHRASSGSPGGRGTESGPGPGPGPKRHTLATAVAIDPGVGAEGVRLLLEDAIVRRTPVRMTYLKPGDAAPAERVVHPYALVTAEGAWYLLAYSPERQGVREFRLDRILAAEATEGGFELPADFDPAWYTHEGKPYHASEDTEAVVRYSARVAPWVRERWGGQAQADGSVVVRHRVADPRWLVRQLLGFAGDAVVEAPAEMREAVRRTAEDVARRNG